MNKEFAQVSRKPLWSIIEIIVIIAILIALGFIGKMYYDQFGRQESINKQLKQNNALLTKQLTTAKKDLADLKNQDQYKINQQLQETIKNIQTTYKKSISLYEKLTDLHQARTNTKSMDVLFAQVLAMLADQNYASASATLTTLEGNIQQELSKLAAVSSQSTQIPAPASNTPPGSGFSRQQVTTEIGSFTVAIIAADLGSTRVIVDTASGGDCRNDCPVLPLAAYVSRTGAFAGINGSYFCPAAYPSCAGKTNSFDTLLMNKDKVYFNSDNNIYSTVPVAVFGSGFARFIGRSSDWGRDTSVDGVIANQPLVLSGGNIAFGGDGDPKKGSKGSRSFVANKGSTVYIGIVYNATVAEVGYTLKALGLENGLNLDNGGSTALWFGGYKAGPGRDLPNAILFLRR